MADSLTTLKQLKQELDAAYQSLNKLEKGSEAYSEALQKIEETTNELNSANKKLEDSSQNINKLYNDTASSVSNLDRGFKSLSSSIGITTDSNSQLSKVISSFNNFKGLTQGVSLLSKGVGGANNIFKAFSATLKASPIGVVTTALGALVGVFSLFSSSTKEAIDYTELLDKSMEALNRRIADNNDSLEYNIRLLKAQGASEDEILDIRVANAKENIRLIELQTKYYETYYKTQYDNGIELANMLGIEVPEALQTLTNAYIENTKLIQEQYDAIAKIEQDREVARVARETARNTAEVNRAIELNNQLRKIYIDRITEIGYAENLIIANLTKAREEEFKAFDEYNQSIAESLATRIASELEVSKQQLEIEERLYNAQNPENLSFEEQIEQAKVKAEVNLAIAQSATASYEQQIAAIDGYIEALAAQGQAEQQLARQKEIYEKQKLDVTKDALAVGSKLLGESTAEGKVLAAAAATISTYEAGALALASIPYPLNLVALSTTIASGLLAVKEIFKVNVPNSSSAGSLSSSTVSSIPNVPQLANPITETHNNLNAYDEDFFSRLQPVLVVDDYNRVQRRVAVTDTETTFT